MSNDRNEARRKRTSNLPSPTENPSPGGLLNFTIPTEIVDLPSKGRMYPVGHPLHGKDTVEIRHMTAKEEDILSSQSLLRKGVAIDRMLNSIIVEEGVEVESLIIGDKNALMYAARITGYGSSYDVFIDCDSCEREYEWSFDLSKYTEGYSDIEVDNEDLRFMPNGTVEFELPKSKVMLQIKALTGEDEKRLGKIREMKEKNNLPDAGLTDTLKTMIFSANGVEDRDQINRFVDMMPASDAKLLRDVYKNVMPNVILVQESECSHCGNTVEMEVPITGDFFWPG